jgi:peptide/nickel transport system permease protein
MWSYIVRRILLGVLVLFGVVTITFVLVRIIPSEPAASWVGPRATAEQIEQAKIELGLDKPLYVQYVKYISGLIKGNWGYSLRTKQPVIEDLKAYIPATLELVIFSMILSLIFGIPLGILAAVRQDGWPDHFCRFFSVSSVSLPTFWLGMIFQIVFFRQLGLLPLGGRLSNMAQFLYPVDRITGMILFDSLITGNMPAFGDAFKHIILPCLTLAAYPIGLVAKMTRSSLLEVLNEDYIRTARAYGLPERMIINSYALKNALGPTITVLALSAGYSLVNTFLVESIFNWPGLGGYTSLSVITSDFPAVLGVTFFAACCFVVLNLIADLLLAAIDPRVRL